MDNKLQRIIDNGRLEDMQELSDIYEDMLEIIRDIYPEQYKKIRIKMHKMIYGNHLDRETAEEIVADMRPYGERWTFEETSRLQQERGLNRIVDADFYTVMNQGYNDYINLLEENIDKYIVYTLDFIEDEDAKPDKVIDYFL